MKHEKEIFRETSLKGVHIYCVLHHVSAQQYGPLIEKYIISKFGYQKISASECRGDCMDPVGRDVEIKASLGGGKLNKYNYVQIRLSQEIDYYLLTPPAISLHEVPRLTGYHLTMENVEEEGELYLFRVPKESMQNLIREYGGYAHGTVKEHGPVAQSFESEKILEYAIRPTYGDACWQALMDFRIAEEDLPFESELGLGL
jgi:hypothetical protein